MSVHFFVYWERGKGLKELFWPAAANLPFPLECLGRVTCLRLVDKTSIRK